MIKALKRLANLPAYLPGKPVETLERELGIVGAIKLASNENPLGPSKKGVAALKTGIKEVSRYPDSGATLLKEGLAQKWAVDSNQVIIGNGSDEIIALVARALLLPGDEAIMADPSFSIYSLATRSCYGRAISIPLKEGRHDLPRMAESVTKNTRVIFICNPNNPTGTIVRQGEVSRFLSAIPKTILVVFDEAYAEYATDPAYPSSRLLQEKRFPIIFLRTFSKIYGLAGLRIGYGIGPPELIDLLNRIRQPFNVNSLAQRAALAALSDEGHVKKSVELNEKGKRYLYRQFNAIGISYLPTEANFVYFSLPARNGRRFNRPSAGTDDALAKSVYDALLHKGVIVRYLGNGHLRVSIGTLSEMRRFIRSFRETVRERD